MSRLLKVLIALDQFFGALLFDGINPDETISAYCWRKGYMRRVAVIDWIMRDEWHCYNAYMSEKHGTQNAPGDRE
jgi:hypothetical protein